MKRYNKLVRDKIPEIIRANREVPHTRILGAKEYKRELLKKLLEETKEVIKSESKEELIKELGDVQEVMTAIYNVFGIECGDVTNLARKRRNKRGAFKRKIFLESVEKNG